MKKRLAALLLLLLVLCGVPGWRNTACALELQEEGTVELYQAQTQASKSLILSPKSVSMTRGGSRTLTLTQGGKSVRTQADWKSSNSKVATVKNGVITPKNFGVCTVTAQKDGYQAACKVTVKPKRVVFRSVRKKSAGKIYLSWENVKGVSGYQLYRSTSKNGTYCKVKTFSKDSYSSYTNTVTRNKTYYYKIRAYYKTKEGTYLYGAWSEIKTVKA